MSNSTLLQDELITAFIQGQFDNWLGIAAIALYIYDFILTLPLEISEIWSSRFSGATLAYLLNRYGLLGYVIFHAIASYAPISDVSTCSGLTRASSVLIALGDCGLISIFTLRTYAIYYKNWMILPVLVLQGLARISLDFAKDQSQISYTIVPPPFSLLGPCSMSPTFLGARLDTAASVLVLAFDTIVIILTVARTCHGVWQSRKAGVRSTLSSIILRDGILYYISIEVLVVANIIVDLIPLNTASSIYLQTIISNFQIVLAATLTNRLVLNLHRLPSGDETVTSTLPDIAFGTNPILGNIGAPVRDDSIDLGFTDGEGNVAPEMEGLDDNTENKGKGKAVIQA